MKFKTIKNKKNGFALLFSVLVSSLLLTIGLSIFNIALKELAISTASRQSIYAFYAADSGLEYALYHDTKIGDIFSEAEINTILNSGLNSSTSTDTKLVDETDGPNFNLTITKEKNTGQCGDQAICTSIISTGHDSVSGDRVERAIYESY